MGNGVSGAFIYMIDNSACEPLTNNRGVSKQSEHYMRWQQFLRWLVFHGLAVVIWVSTDFETGDVLTKILPGATYLRHKAKMLNRRMVQS